MSENGRFRKLWVWFANLLHKLVMNEMSWEPKIKEREAAHRLTQREEKRLSILRVAAQAFNEHGFYQTSLNQIAQALNVTKPTLYYYVKNKDDILDGILEIAVAQFRQMIADVTVLDADAFGKLEAFFQQYAALVSDTFGACLILMRTNAPEEKFRQPYHELSAEVFIALQELLAKGMANGLIAASDPKFMASVLLASLNEGVYWHQVQGRRSPEETAVFLLDVFQVGLKMEGTTAD